MPIVRLPGNNVGVLLGRGDLTLALSYDPDARSDREPGWNELALYPRTAATATGSRSRVVRDGVLLRFETVESLRVFIRVANELLSAMTGGDPCASSPLTSAGERPAATAAPPG